jgi:hypothetical protein
MSPEGHPFDGLFPATCEKTLGRGYRFADLIFPRILHG